jgi:hypothetical protein
MHSHAAGRALFVDTGRPSKMDMAPWYGGHCGLQLCQPEPILGRVRQQRLALRKNVIRGIPGARRRGAGLRRARAETRVRSHRAAWDHRSLIDCFASGVETVWWICAVDEQLAEVNGYAAARDADQHGAVIRGLRLPPSSSPDVPTPGTRPRPGPRSGLPARAGPDRVPGRRTASPRRCVPGAGTRRARSADRRVIDPPHHPRPLRVQEKQHRDQQMLFVVGSAPAGPDRPVQLGAVVILENEFHVEPARSRRTLHLHHPHRRRTPVPTHSNTVLARAGICAHWSNL